MVPSTDRKAVAKRLRRRNILTSIRGIETEELVKLWEKYKDSPVVNLTKRKTPNQSDTNYDRLVRIIKNFAAEYEEYFVGWYRGAKDYLPEIQHFWERIDRDKVNSDTSFIPKEIEIFFMPPSDWYIDEQERLDPLEITDYMRELYLEYLI